MLIQSFKYRKVALLTITSLLLISICILPCSGFAMGHGDKTSPHGEAHAKKTQMEVHGKKAMPYHGCHGTAEAALHISPDSRKSDCPHCYTLTPGLLKDAGSVALFTQDTFSGASINHESPALNKVNPLEFDTPPPKHKNQIHSINSIYLI